MEVNHYEKEFVIRAEAYGVFAKRVLLEIFMQNSKLRKFIIITSIVPLEHDSVIRRENALGDPLAR
jgi:hypothetical protein